MATGSSPSSDAGSTPTWGTAAPAPERPDWPAQAADKIVEVVGQVRDKTTGPAITAARGVVYGMFALLVGIVVLILLAISAVRLLDVYLPDAWVGEDHTWVAHLLIGAAFTIAGMVAWSRRRPRPE